MAHSEQLKLALKSRGGLCIDDFLRFMCPPTLPTSAGFYVDLSCKLLPNLLNATACGSLAPPTWRHSTEHQKR